MMKSSRGGPTSGKAFPATGDAGSDAVRRMADAGERLMQLQAQAAGVAFTDVAMWYAEALEDAVRNLQARQWRRVRRAQMRSVVGPLQAWIDASAGLQAVLAASLLQTWMLMLFPAVDAPPQSKRGHAERRTTSVVIPFPDRRRHGIA